MKQRLIHFAQSTIAIAYRGQRPTQIVDFLYHYLPQPKAGEPHATFLLDVEENSLDLRLYHDGVALARSPASEEMAELLLGQSGHQLATTSRGGLLLHAAGVNIQGRGILLPGASGAGKSTLTTWFLSRGFRYLTDELVYIPEQTTTLQALTRPLNLKQTARSAWWHLCDYEAHSAFILTSLKADLVSPALFNDQPPLQESPLDLILFPHYQTDSPFVLEKLSPAQTGAALMQCLVNARNLPDHGFSEVAGIARTIPAYRLRYGHLAQLGASGINRLLSG